MDKKDENIPMNPNDEEETQQPLDSSHDVSSLPLQQQSSNSTECRNLRKKFSLLYVIAGVLVVGIIFNIVLIKQSREPENQEYDKKSYQAPPGASRSGEVCIYHTNERYLKNLSDELDTAYCEPRILNEGTLDGWGLCNELQNEYIRKECLCDKKIQCTTSRHDLFQKQNCSTCRDKDHCPCVYGHCIPCNNERTVAEPKCTCYGGAEGKFCNKIAKRVCTPVQDQMDGLPLCNGTNENACIFRTENYTFKCNVSDKLPSMQDCVNYEASEVKPKAVEGHSDKKENNPLSPFLLGLLVLQSIALICLMIYIFRIKCRNTGNTHITEP